MRKASAKNYDLVIRLVSQLLNHCCGCTGKFFLLSPDVRWDGKGLKSPKVAVFTNMTLEGTAFALKTALEHVQSIIEREAEKTDG